METARPLHYVARHGNSPSDRRPPARMAPAPPPQPARSRARGRDLDQAPELPGNRARAALARDGAEARRAARRAAARAQRAAGLGRLRAGVSASAGSRIRRCSRRARRSISCSRATSPTRPIAVDRHWTLIAHNAAVPPLLAAADPALLQPPVNVLRLSLHPKGLAPRIENLAEWRAHLLMRLRQQIDVTADGDADQAAGRARRPIRRRAARSRRAPT